MCPRFRECGLQGPTGLSTPTRLQPPLVSTLQPGPSPGRSGLLSYANCCSAQLEIVPTEVGAAPPSWRLCGTFLVPGKLYLEEQRGERPRKASVGELTGAEE